jgi:hypothetical protein
MWARLSRLPGAATPQNDAVTQPHEEVIYANRTNVSHGLSTDIQDCTAVLLGCDDLETANRRLGIAFRIQRERGKIQSPSYLDHVPVRPRKIYGSSGKKVLTIRAVQE